MTKPGVYTENPPGERSMSEMRFINSDLTEGPRASLLHKK
jgi:hypothetical protein